MSDELPNYVPRDGELLAAPPIKIGTTLYMFLVDADWDALQKMCDTYLNLGGEVVYRPLLPMAILYCSRVDNHPQSSPIGWCPEKDFGVWVPVTAGRIVGALYTPERVLAFTPYIWVDNGVALIGGRTVFGFCKEIGTRMDMPASTSDPARFYCETQVVPVYGPESQVVERPIFDVHKIDASVWEELKQLWHSGENLLDAIKEILEQRGPGHLPVPTPALILDLLRDAGRKLPMVFLKQFPDATDATKACYQAIVEAGVDITSPLQGGFLPGDYAVDIWRYDSHRLVESLGLQPSETHADRAVVKSLFQGWFKFDAVVRPGRIVYQRPGQAAGQSP